MAELAEQTDEPSEDAMEAQRFILLEVFGMDDVGAEVRLGSDGSQLRRENTDARLVGVGDLLAWAMEREGTGG